MGLDMYLHTRIYGGKYIGEAAWPILAKANETFGAITYDELPSFELQVKSAYWRKANAVHQWFVDNCAGGEDDCRPVHVSIEQITELRDLCSLLLLARNPEQAREKLPPRSGFFFGSTDIDEWYWSDLEDTVKQLTRIIDAHTPAFTYQYEASW